MAPTFKAKNITKKVLKELKRKEQFEKSPGKHKKLKSESTSSPQDQDLALKEQSESQEAIVRNLSTLSIAVPGSILENAQTLELRSYLAGQIARAASVYKVDEVVVFDDLGEIGAHEDCNETFDGVRARHCCIQLARILQYLECPQYLRKHLFLMHEDLSKVGVLNPLDAPHHLRQDEECRFREGVILNRPGKGSYVNIGLRKDCQVRQDLQPGIRVTVELDSDDTSQKKNLRGRVTSPNHAKHHVGYWGYRVRIANTISEVFTRSPFADGYDLTVGTSDKGERLDHLPWTPESPVEYSHALLVFGGLHGLELALENDIQQLSTDPALLFDYYVNTCPDQGSRTIRTEEAVLITLAELRRVLKPKNKVPSLRGMFSSVRVPAANSSQPSLTE